MKRPLLHVAVDGAAAFLKHMWATDGNVEVELTPALVRGRLAVSITKVHPGSLISRPVCRGLIDVQHFATPTIGTFVLAGR